MDCTELNVIMSIIIMGILKAKTPLRILAESNEKSTEMFTGLLRS